MKTIENTPTLPEAIRTIRGKLADIEGQINDLTTDQKDLQTFIKVSERLFPSVAEELKPEPDGKTIGYKNATFLALASRALTIDGFVTSEHDFAPSSAVMDEKRDKIIGFLQTSGKFKSLQFGTIGSHPNLTSYIYDRKRFGSEFEADAAVSSSRRESPPSVPDKYSFIRSMFCLKS